MSSVTHPMVSFWNQMPQYVTDAYTLAAGKIIYQGVLAFSVNGKVYDTDSVINSSGALYASIAGADANGGVQVWSKQQNVRYIQYDTNGVHVVQPLVVGLDYNPTLKTIDIFVQLETDSMGVVQSKAIQVVRALLAHGEISKYLRFGYTGTGLGVAGNTPGTPADYILIPQVKLLGVAESTYDNSSSLADLVDTFRFKTGVCRLASLPSNPVSPSMIGGLVGIADNITVKGTPNTIDYTAKLIDILSSGAIYVDITG